MGKSRAFTNSWRGGVRLRPRSRFNGGTGCEPKMIGSWGAALIPGLLLVLIAGFARSYGGSWLEPGALFALVWAFYVLVPLAFAPDYEVWPGGVWWILVSALSVCCGSWWVTRNRSK